MNHERATKSRNQHILEKFYGQSVNNLNDLPLTQTSARESRINAYFLSSQQTCFLYSSINMYGPGAVLINNIYTYKLSQITLQIFTETDGENLYVDNSALKETK